jgi:hypothetical protein
MVAAADLTGQRYGRLVAVRRVQSLAGHARWLWRCDCGGERIALATNVKTGDTTSCGCANLERITTHGEAGTRTYRAWLGMKARAKGSGTWNKKYYQDRGITVCARWVKSFQSFFADMGECPAGQTLERIDNEGGYEPGNCKWATQSEQMANTRRTRRVIVDGVEMCLLHACKKLGVRYRTAMRRISRGMTPQEAMRRG